MASRRHHAVGALTAGAARTLLDAVDREFAGAAKNGKHRAVFEEIDSVVAPLAGGDLAAVETENPVEFAPTEGDLDCGGGRANLAPAQRARFSVAEFHAAPPSSKFRSAVMIAPDERAGKGLTRGLPAHRHLGFF